MTSVRATMMPFERMRAYGSLLPPVIASTFLRSVAFLKLRMTSSQAVHRKSEGTKERRTRHERLRAGACTRRRR